MPAADCTPAAALELVVVLVEVVEGEALRFASWELHHTELKGSPRRSAVK